MKRRRRMEILIQENGQLAKKLSATIIDAYECKEILEPQYGLTMIKMRESAKKSLFYIGEVLITEAKVEINNCIGIGIVVGMEEELAKQLAIIDAAYKAELPETITWRGLLIEAEKQNTKERAKKQAELFKTKVSFETMEV
ncbi:phosphonate C-P lyase system protein PhnG [Psychrobacillus sp. NPDC093180]|uniref:phosphonate C-P lyase system protein PhnG n=1 Tax=Psychrobacillus sp. NPDC093180 TaxID=3364489 RepID=UPI0038305B09